MTELLSWGRYPRIPQRALPIYWEDQVADAVSRVQQNGTGTTLAYGCGRSYGDSCLAASNRVLHTQGLNRVVKADWCSGIIRAQAGMTIADLITLALPRGWFPPVTPGTKFVSLGGAVANDVHGKNHHRVGTFGCHVTRLCLYRSDIGVVECSSDDQPELFAATIGGLGLTGIMLWVELQLKPVTSTNLRMRTIRFPGLKRFFGLSATHDDEYEYSASWIDCMASGSALGRGHYIVADHMDGDIDERPRGSRLAMPIDPPFSLVNKWTMRLFNAVYFNRVLRQDRQTVLHFNSYFYPLDGIDNWNRIYGRRGFQQYQCVVPAATAPAAIERVVDEIRRAHSGSFLTVLKCCGSIQSPGVLSFPLEGFTLAMDFPQSVGLDALFQRLDELVHEAGGRLYPAKDAHMQKEHFQHAYPDWAQVDAQRDPALMSRFWQRVTGP